MKKENSNPQKAVSMKRRILLAVGLPFWVLASFFLAQVVLVAVFELLAAINISFGGIDASVINAIVAAVVYTLTLVIVIGVPLKLRGAATTKAELGLTRLPNWFDLLLAPASFVVYMIVAGILLAVVTGLFPGFDAEEAQDVGFENLTYYYEYVLAFATLVVVAPIAEEMLIRGYLYGKLKKATSVVVAVIISSLLFSAMHFQWNVAINVLPLGIIMAVLREMTGSIWAGVLLHMLKNGVAFYLLFVNPNIINMIGG